MSVRLRLKVDRRIFAALIDLDIEIEPVAFVEVAHARTFDRADVHKRIGLAVIALDEAEAFHRVEELDRAARALAGKLTARTTVPAALAAAETTWTGFARFARAIRHGKRLALDLEIGRGNFAAPVNKGETKRLAFGKASEARLLDRADMDENIFRAVIAHDEAEAFLTIEEFYDAGAFAHNLGRHAATGTTTAAATTETTATAAITKATTGSETAAITETTAITKAATKPSTALLGETTKIVAAETVPLILAAPAASPVETHALIFTFASPN